jgi:hypothetical protein
MGPTVKKSLRVLGSVVLLLPLLSVAQPSVSPCAACSAMPEGGSPIEYLVGMGMICVGGLYLRARLRKRQES